MCMHIGAFFELSYINQYIFIYIIYMNYIIYKIESIIWGAPLLILLIVTHIYFTFKLKFPQKYTLKGLKYMLFSDKKNDKEGISSFKSLMTILAGTLGTGNIVGIATAVNIGGIGSIFWIFVAGVFAIATKYAETYIVLKYRKKDKYDNKKYCGGTMYVLKTRIGNNFLAIFFSIFVILTSLGMGCMIQSNAINSSVLSIFNVNKYFIALITTLICSYAIFGNEKRISNVSSIIVPLATIVYLYLCFYSLYIYRFNILSGISNILHYAFDFRAVSGGILGSLAIKAINQGLSKGIFTNEAGLGSSPMFDVTVKEKNIKKQALISSTSVFIDTVILCTLTGIVIASSNIYMLYQDPINMINEVFKVVPFGNILLIFSISAFAIATIPCSSYYGKVGIKFLFNSKMFYQIVYKILCVIFVFVGSISAISSVWSIANIANALMAIPNIYMLFYLRKEIEC